MFPIYERYLKDFKPITERRLIAESLLWQHTTTSNKNRKAYTNLCRNFCAGESH